MHRSAVTRNMLFSAPKFPVSPTSCASGPWDPKPVGRAVLIVDDDEGFSELAARVLTSWGHLVVGVAGSVAGALTRALELRPDIVLVDIGLPDGDGFSVTEQLVAMPCRMGVVLMSSDPRSANLSAVHRAGAAGFVPKDRLSSAELRTYIEQG